MSKTFTKILISVILVGIFAMPISSIVRLENEKITIGIEVNKAEAQEQEDGKFYYIYKPPLITETVSSAFNTEEECVQNLVITDAIPGYSIVTGCYKFTAKPTTETLRETAGVSPEIDFGCGITDLDNCFIQLLYWVGFKLTSFFAYLSARFLDYFMYYSISDEAYRNEFMGKAWGAVRDIANIFFIIALLYVAIKTILNMGVSSGKKMVGTIIVIALLINFSLFVTQVVIDASNILANIFYHQITAKDENGKLKEGSGGEKSVTVQLTTIFNPQNVLTGTPVEDHEGTWLIVVSLATIISIFMIIIFLSTAFLFVGRIVELWMAMIFSPIAFASKTIGGKITFFGWDEWLTAMLKSAFLAPIFIFFLYIIILLGKLISTVNLGSSGDASTSSATNVDWAMKTIVPFAIIFFMLFIAKKVAKDYSGRVGKAVAGATTALTGLALGGAALGSAALLRNTVGSTMARASRGDTLSQRYAKDPSSLKWYQKPLGAIGAGIGLDKFYGKDVGLHDIKTKKALGVTTGIGGILNKAQKNTAEVDHARHELDEAKKEAHLENVPDGKLSFAERQRVKDAFGRKKKQDYQNMVINGEADLIDPNSNNVIAGVKGKDAYMTSERARVTNAVESAKAAGDVDSSGKLTDQGRKNVEDTLKAEFNLVLKASTDKLTEKKYTEFEHEAKDGVNVGQRIVSKAGSGSYDIRNISQIAADKRAGLGVKATAGLISAVALGIRMGMKKGIGADHGTGKGDLVTDLKGLLGAALGPLKDLNMNISIPKSGGHGGGDHGHGGGDHGHH